MQTTDEQIKLIQGNIENIAEKARQYELKQEKLDKILALTKQATQAPCMEVMTSECYKFCHKCKDSITDNGKSCMQYALYKIRKICEAQHG